MKYLVFLALFAFACEDSAITGTTEDGSLTRTEKIEADPTLANPNTGSEEHDQVDLEYLECLNQTTDNSQERECFDTLTEYHDSLYTEEIKDVYLPSHLPVGENGVPDSEWIAPLVTGVVYSDKVEMCTIDNDANVEYTAICIEALGIVFTPVEQDSSKPINH